MATYACSDLHGMLHFYYAIKDKLGPEDRVFYLGDAGDRGPHPWETIKAILSDPQFIYIKGNHEQMLCDALADYFSSGYPDYHSMQLLTMNGGDTTFEQAIQDPQAEKLERKLYALPLFREYVNTRDERVILSHAGFTPWKSDFYEDRDDVFKVPKRDDLLWDRDHSLDTWTAEDCVDCYIVHGHTPVPYLLDEIDPCCTMQEIEPGALWYDDGRKCCVDCGAVFTGICVLLNLDTWDEEVFCSEPYL